MATKLNGKITPIVFENISSDDLEKLLEVADDLGLDVDSDIEEEHGDTEFSIAIGTSKKYDISMNTRKAYYREKFPRARFFQGYNGEVGIAIAAIQDAIDSSRRAAYERSVVSSSPEAKPAFSAPVVETVADFEPGTSIVEVVENGKLVKVRADRGKLRELFMSGKEIVSIQ